MLRIIAAFMGAFMFQLTLSQAASIYDPKHSLWWAWREVARHWGMLCEISILNNQKGHAYLSFRDGRSMLKQNGALQSRLKFH